MTRPALRILRTDLPRDAVLVTPRQAADAVTVPIGTIHSWAHRHEIRPAGYVDGHPLYPLAEVTAAELRLRDTPAAAPRKRRLLAVTNP